VEGEQRIIRFDRDVKLRRDGQNMEADTAVAYLTPDESQIRLMELRGRSRIAIDNAVGGGLKELTGRDIDLTYGADGYSLEQALLTGDGAIVLAGAAENAARRITANSIHVTLAPDGLTPVVMTARESVILTMPAERAVPARTIEADLMESTGEAPRGLTQARFTGDVEYREAGPSINREASAAILDVALEPGMAGFREARFSRRVHFVDGEMTSDAAEGRYDLAKGILELTGSEPGILRPRVVNARLTIDATRVDVTLAGPHLRATGDVKSVVQPTTKADAAQPARLPSMFKPDRPINVTAEALDYDGAAHKATYRGNAQLWQDDQSLKGGTIVLDDAKGDLTAEDEVTTVNVRNVTGASKKPERKRSISTASSFRYEEADRRATYTGNAHMNSTDGDITAARIELYLKPSSSSRQEGAAGSAGDDLERAEAFEGVTLRDQNRTTTGNHLIYTTADERYVITGTPVKVIDECRRETIGRTLTYLKSAETITIDGNEQTRTQTKGGSQCP
jgi:lipopolysaccharide export system protein LptA